MITLLAKLLIKNTENRSAPSVKKAYAALSSAVGILLNLFLSAAKLSVGLMSHSIAISADGFNNLADAGTSIMSFLGFRIARYSGGEIHPFGHGRIEWIMSIFTSIAVIFMGIKLADVSIISIQTLDSPTFSIELIVVLGLSILVKYYMYCYNSRLAKLTESSSLKAIAADSVSDALGTSAVLFSTIISHISGLNIDGWCGLLVSFFIMIAGLKSLWEVLERIMGTTANQNTRETIESCIKEHPPICAVHNLMIHDYGFGYFVTSMRVEGYEKDSIQLHQAINAISHKLYYTYRCDCFIQIDYLLHDPELTEKLIEQINSILQYYHENFTIENFRLIDSGIGGSYPADHRILSKKCESTVSHHH